MQITSELQALKTGNLSARTLKVRDAIIEKCKDQSVEEMSRFIKQLLDQETNEQKRLGLLAARVHLLRTKISTLLGIDIKFDAVSDAKGSVQVTGASANTARDDDDSASLPESATNNNLEWTRVKILEDSEVNSVRFPAGVIIDALAGDAEKLIEMGKAEIVNSAELAATPEAKEADDK